MLKPIHSSNKIKEKILIGFYNFLIPEINSYYFKKNSIFLLYFKNSLFVQKEKPNIYELKNSRVQKILSVLKTTTQKRLKIQESKILSFLKTKILQKKTQNSRVSYQ